MKRNELNRISDLKNNKDYRKWFYDVCEFISKETKKPLSKSDCIVLFDNYYQQLKSGRN